MSCSCSPTAADGTDPVGVTTRSGWAALGDDPDRITDAAGGARTAGKADVADAMIFYADSARAGDDVVTVVATGDADGVLAVRRHGDRDTPLETVVTRTVGEAKEQDVEATATPEKFHGVSAWRVEYPPDPSGRRSVTHWFDTGRGRYTAETIGAADDVAALADAVTIR
jgi:hypothetical protein